MTNAIKDEVKMKYGEVARRVTSGESATCCAPSCCGTEIDPITRDLYDGPQKSVLPDAALKASLGCGNPTALAKLQPGEVVLDLGSGGGIDVLLSARRVGPTGKAYGLDMTDDMLALARENQKETGLTNVEFLKGEIENIPLPDCSVDVIISNCVINLSADKDKVLREVFRVLKPGGRFAVSDVVVRGEVPDQVRRSMLLWVGCIAGALRDDDYIAKLKQAGFDSIEIEPTRIYNIGDARAFLNAEGVNVDAIASQVEGKFISAFVRAQKPDCGCGPNCCNSPLWSQPITCFFSAPATPRVQSWQKLFCVTGANRNSAPSAREVIERGSIAKPCGRFRWPRVDESLQSKSWNEFAVPKAPELLYLLFATMLPRRFALFG